MKYRKLGRTSLRVSEICLGTMIFGEEESRGVNEEESTKQIDHFINEGGNFIDTADVYANGRSEKILGKSIKGRRDDLVIATKCRFPMGKGVNNRGLSRKYILQAVEASLSRLDTSYIDLFYLHCNTIDMSLIEIMSTLNDLVVSGKIRYTGVSNFRAWEFMKALDISEANRWARFEAAQYQYSLVERNIENEYSSLCETEEVSILPWGPLGGGFLSGKYSSDQKPQEGTRLAMMPDHTEESWKNRSIPQNWEILKVMEEIKSNTGYSHPQIALSWLLDQPAVTSIIIGTRTMEQLKDNMDTLKAELSKEDLMRLSEVSKRDPDYPYGFIKNYCCD
jgi:aryl-alcohol dehydrogenase-like predicted oxidoreductase